VRSVALKDVCRITNGGTPKSGVESLWHGGVAWLTPAEMGKRLTPYVRETARTISPSGLANSSAKLVPPGSVILSTRAPIGHLAINERPMAFNQGCRGLTPGGELDTSYLYYFLYFSRNALDDLGTGTTFKELSSSNLANFRIPLPPLDEQRRIVAVLDKAFAGIATATANAQKNLTNARALFEAHVEQVFTEAGEDWLERRLCEVCEKITDGTHQTPKYFDNGVVFLSSRNVKNRIIDWDNIKYVDAAQHLAMQKRLSPKLGDILLAKNGTTGVAAMVDRDITFDIYVSLALLRPLKGLLPELLLNFVNSPVAKRQFNKRLKGTGVPNLHLEEIREVVIAFPQSSEAQKDLNRKLDSLLKHSDKLASQYAQKLAALNQLKQSLLHKAFAGELT
jgi:type I restriction enzyme S subunit